MFDLRKSIVAEIEAAGGRHDEPEIYSGEPGWARRITGTYQPGLVYRLAFAPSDRLKAALVRWAYPELPCKALALARVAAGRSAAAA